MYRKSGERKEIVKIMFTVYCRTDILNFLLKPGVYIYLLHIHIFIIYVYILYKYIYIHVHQKFM